MKLCVLYICLLANPDSTQTKLLSFSKQDTVRSIKEVIIRSNSLDRTTRYTLNKKEINQLPPFFGEFDLMKAIQNLPGVSSTQEGSTDLQVRGGSKDQNRILLDGMPIYSNSHVFGLLSTINPLIVENVELFSGAFPSQYGGKLSSFINIQSSNSYTDSIEKTRGAFELGITSGKFNLLFPITKNNLSVQIAGRRSFQDLFTQFQTRKTTEKIYFYDLNGILEFRPDSFNHFKLSTYFTQDRILFETGIPNKESNGLGKHQSGGSILWKRNQLKHQFDLRISLVRYGNTISESKEFNEPSKSYRNEFETNLTHLDVLWKNNLKINDLINLQFGTQFQRYIFNPIRFTGFQFNQTFDDSPISKNHQNDAAVFASSIVKWNRNHLDVGFRFSSLFNRDKAQEYFLEPRISFAHSIEKYNLNLNVAYSKMSQPIHEVSDPGLGIPLELQIPFSKNLKPQEAHILSLGLEKSFSLNSQTRVDLKAESFWKESKNLILFKDGYDSRSLIINFPDGVYLPQTTEDAFISGGYGQSKGLEFQLKAFNEKWSYILNYTLSNSDNKFSEIDQGLSFPAFQHRKHIFNNSVNYNLSNKWSFSANFSYLSGAPIHLPESYYSIGSGNNAMSNMNTVYVYGKRNSFKMRDYHRLDVNVSRHVHLKNKSLHFNLGVYNVYNRKNSNFYYMFIDNEKNLKVKSISMFPLMPSFSVKLDF